MMKTLQQYKWVILIVAVLAFTFYWYELRPARIADECSEKAREVALEEQQGGYQMQLAVYDFFYKSCIRERRI